MQVFIFQHVEFEGPGAILPYLQSKGHEVHIVRLYAGDKIPHEDDVDFAILMGGPMSVLDEARYPYFMKEKELCRDMVQMGKPILGICLGAQMIACAFGAAIKKNPEKEIGWYPITLNEKFSRELHLPSSINVFHWHGETFNIPDVAEPFASSQACKNQAFMLGSAIALQFHLEATLDSMESMLNNGSKEIESSVAQGCKFVQNADEIRKFSKQNKDIANDVLAKILDYMLEKK